MRISFKRLDSNPDRNSVVVMVVNGRRTAIPNRVVAFGFVPFGSPVEEKGGGPRIILLISFRYLC
jgi:hypothetical protein